VTMMTVLPATLRTVEVFDAHQHHGFVSLYQDPEQEASAAWYADEIAARRRVMDEIGIDRTLILPGHSYLRPDGLADTIRVNDGIKDYGGRDVRFAAPVGVVEPLYGKRGLPEIHRLNELGFAGVSYHSRFQGVATNDVWIHRHLDVLGELGMVPFVHSYAESTLEATLLVGELARAHPGLTIVVLDGFGTFHHTLECISLAERFEQLVFDTALAYSPVALRQFVSAVGAERLMFGSDVYSHPVTFRTSNTPAALQAAGFSAGELRAVLGGNLRRILASRLLPA
jgi:uncharacterized protein